jgi:transmembrane sensor
MIRERDKLRSLISKYVLDSCSKDELEELFSYISQTKDNKVLSDEFLATWNSIRPEEQLSSIDDDQLYGEIERRISVSPIRQSRFMWARAAAVLLVVLSAGMIYFYLYGSGSVEKKGAPVASANRPTPSSHSLIKLPDGSSVLLNDNSTLDYATFTANTREVVLKGEAYFDIAKDAKHPFVIHTGKLNTRVLGTAFNIRAYPEENDVTVTVTKGKVEVKMENKTLGIIIPNQQISFNKQNGSTVQQQVHTDSILVWKQNDLVFDNTNFEEAAEIISNRFNVTVTFENELLKNCRFTASFLNENNIDQVLTVLCDVNNATYEKKNDLIIIKGEGCNKPK